jgi:hypothetical protein
MTTGLIFESFKLKLPLRDLSHLVQEIPIETKDYEGLRSVWNRLRDLSHLVQEIPIETKDYEGLRSVWNRMLINQPDKYNIIRNTHNLK